ncbi:hypothetical protein [Lysinibacillus sp. TE18511]
MEKIVYCTHCKVEHVVSITKDSTNDVGLFCNTTRKLVDAYTTKWDGKDVYEPMREFARKNVDLQAISRLKPEKVEGLARKMAFMYSNSDDRIYASYAFLAYHMHTIITRLRSEVRAKGIGGSRK